MQWRMLNLEADQSWQR